MQAHHPEFDSYISEIKSYDFNLNDREVYVFATLASVLNNPEAVMRHLAALETLVHHAADAKGILASPQLMREFNRSKVDNKNRFKLLSDVLYSWAIENGLVNIEQGEANFLKINRALSPQQFMNVLKHGKFFKDIGVPPEHGSWTHFIQWFILFEHVKANPDTGLTVPMLQDMYKLLGDERCIGSRMNMDKKIEKTSMWFLICDRHSNINRQFDFRAPDTLHRFIWSHPDSFPFLRTILGKRYKNEAMLRANIPNVEDIGYSPNKLLRKENDSSHKLISSLSVANP